MPPLAWPPISHAQPVPHVFNFLLVEVADNDAIGSFAESIVRRRNDTSESTECVGDVIVLLPVLRRTGNMHIRQPHRLAAEIQRDNLRLVGVSCGSPSVLARVTFDSRGAVLALWAPCWACAGPMLDSMLDSCWTCAGLIMALCWTHAGLMLDSCWTHDGLLLALCCLLALCWTHAGLVLTLCWTHAGLVLDSLLLLLLLLPLR